MPETPCADSVRHPQLLYAVHFLGGRGHGDSCVPDLYAARLMPFGQEVGCRTMGCDDTWTLTQTVDASIALPAQIEGYGATDA